MDEQEQINRLRALWKSGRDKYRSFFHTLNEVRHEIGDEALDEWCYSKLLIGLEAITRVSGVLTKADKDAVKVDMAVAQEASKQQRIIQRKAREEEKFARAETKAERRKKIAELNLDAVKKENEIKKKERSEKRRQQRQSPQFVWDSELTELVKQFHVAEKQCEAGTEQWIDGTVAKAKLLCAMRDKLSANQDFGQWLTANNISLDKNDRAALVGLGKLEEKHLRKILTETESRSVRIIWQDNRPLKAVEG